jgi:hypothetical protein
MWTVARGPAPTHTTNPAHRSHPYTTIRACPLSSAVPAPRCPVALACPPLTRPLPTHDERRTTHARLFGQYVRASHGLLPSLRSLALLRIDPHLHPHAQPSKERAPPALDVCVSRACCRMGLTAYASCAHAARHVASPNHRRQHPTTRVHDRPTPAVSSRLGACRSSRDVTVGGPGLNSVASPQSCPQPTCGPEAEQSLLQFE